MSEKNTKREKGKVTQMDTITAVEIYDKYRQTEGLKFAVNASLLFVRQRCVGMVLKEYAQARANKFPELAAALDGFALEIEKLNVDKGA